MPDYPWSMAGDREVLREIDPARAHELLGQDDGPLLVDIRERSEWETGWIDEDNARVALAVDGDAFLDRFNARLQRLVTTAANAR